MTKRNAQTPTEQFIQSNSKWVRVIAGPGTGKSFCLKKRLEHLVNHEGIQPEKILVLTFTSVAAQDLKQDIQALHLGNIEVSTLHSLALKLLAREKGDVRLMLDFEVNTMLRDLEPEIGKYRKKEAMLKQYASKGGHTARTDEEKKFEVSLNNWLKQHRGFILDDLIPHMCRYLGNNKAARKRLSYDRVLVDEYQDLNPSEQEFVELLTARRGKLTVIGDDDQSIYEFKGASPDGLREFAAKHPGCEDIRFTECRRCPYSVVEMANRLIDNNKNRIEKEFTAFPDNQAGSYELITCLTAEEEIDKLCEKIQNESVNLSLGQIIVLTPTKIRGRKLYDALQKANVPAALCFRNAIFDSAVVRESFSLLTLAAYPDDLISWRYLLGGEKGARLATSYRHIRDYAKKEKCGILEVLEECGSGKLKIPYTYVLVKWYKEIKAQLEPIKEDPKELLQLLGPGEVQYAEVLARAIKAEQNSGGFPGIRRAVLDAVFSLEASAASDRVRIMSLHAAKGLSAGMVIIMSAVEDLIPLEGKGSVEEQRRLFYVAITRCKGSATGKYPGKLVVSAFTSSEDGNKEYSLTRFVREMGL